MINIEINTSKLEASIADFAKLSRKDLGEVTKQQAGMLVAHVIALTPPGHAAATSDKGGISLSAKKAGESRIASDIANIFPTTRLAPSAIDRLIAARHEWIGPNGHKLLTHVKANSLADMQLVHAQARNPKSGRTRAMGGRFAAITRPALLKQYIKQEMAKVGLLNAGWIGAANALKTASRNVPQWIKRHGKKPGGAAVRNSGPTISIRIFNSQTWFPGDMQRRVALAVRRREFGLKQAIEAVLLRRSKAATARMNR